MANLKGEYQDALDDLLALEKGIKHPNLDVSGISKTLDREIRNLLFHYKDELNHSMVPPKYLNNLTYKARLVFEWNRPGAAFKIQFVNPQNRFFDWEYTNEANPDRIKKGIKNIRHVVFYRVENLPQGKFAARTICCKEDLPQRQFDASTAGTICCKDNLLQGQFVA